MVSYFAHLSHEALGDLLEIHLRLHSGFGVGYAFYIVVAHLQYAADDVKGIVMVGLSFL